MPLAAACLIAFYILALIFVLKVPRRHRHPEDGQAVGCLMLVIFALLLLGGVLGVAWAFKVRWLSTAIFYITVFPVLLATPQLIYKAIRNRGEKAARRGTPIPAEELQAALSDQTHEFRRHGPEPRGDWSDVRYFSPDGRLLCFEREGEKLVPLDTPISWAVKNGRLETIGDIRPGNRNLYTIYRAPDGQIGYYIHAPMSRLNRRLSKLTTQLYAGPPRSATASPASPQSPETPAH
jgi:hypothetical protein